ncbi:unnamed protein product, partial [Amoebophrya sp. A120]
SSTCCWDYFSRANFLAKNATRNSASSGTRSADGGRQLVAQQAEPGFYTSSAQPASPPLPGEDVVVAPGGQSSSSADHEAGQHHEAATDSKLHLASPALDHALDMIVAGGLGTTARGKADQEDIEKKRNQINQTRDRDMCKYHSWRKLAELSGEGPYRGPLPDRYEFARYVAEEDDASSTSCAGGGGPAREQQHFLRPIPALRAASRAFQNAGRH